MIGDGNFISQVPLFGGLDDAQQVSLQQKMGHTTLRRGETLFDEGDLGDRLYIVTEGKVKLGHTSERRPRVSARRPRPRRDHR